MRTYSFLLLISLIASFLLTRWLATRAAERGWARRKDSGEEGEGVPRLGGVSVFFAIGLSIAVLLMFWENLITARFERTLPLGLGLLGAAGFIFFIGLYDDLRGARPWQKLAVQAVAATGLFFAGFQVQVITNPFTHRAVELGWLALPVTILWLAAISNAFNLIDGLDGLAAGVGFFATLALFLMAILTFNPFVAAIAASMAGALLGFLPFNFSPARIYLGDSGSLTVGLILAALSVQSAQKGPILITVAIPLMIFGLPLLDVGVTTARRLLSGHPLFRRDEEHLHHRLLKIGLNKRAAVLVLYGMTALFALASLLLLNYRGAVAPVVALLCGAMAWVMVRQMQYPEFAELDSHVRLALSTQRAVLRNHILIRRTGARLAAAEDAEQVWQEATAVFAALEFERAVCRVNGSHSFGWSSPAQGKSTNGSHGRVPEAWTLSIPLQHNGRRVGVLDLSRSLESGPLLFRVSTLLEFIAQPLSRELLLRLGEVEYAAEPVEGVNAAGLASRAGA
jgi:UDP-GlcNAc:undecaprenyl-phosphate GlcNAc-1-phosphate transferase